MIQAREVHRSFPSPAGTVHAVAGVTLSINDGERVAIVGRSGSGKSTLLHLLGGLDRPTSGSIAVGGKTIEDMTSAQLASYRASVVGTVFQAFHLVSTLSAAANVALPLIFQGVRPTQRKSAAQSALAAVNLEDRAEHRPSQLSGGEQQRVAIARALVTQPRVLLADEPTGNLDSDNAAQVMAVFDEVVAAHKLTVLLVTHDTELAERFADRTVRMHDGQLDLEFSL